MSFFDRPIINSPYEPPSRHWELDLDGRPTDVIVEQRRGSALWTALPGAASTTKNSAQASLVFNTDLSTDATEFNPSPMINDLRQELETWRNLPNPAQWKVTPTTQRLLQHWRAIQQDASQTIRPFFCQLEAVEAAIWLAEVAPDMGRRGRRFLNWISIANNFAVQAEGTPPSDSAPDLMRIAFKLATGAGKTTVMAMLIAWQALNAVRSPNSRRFSKGFLIVTPGITIRDRLRVLMPNDEQSYYDLLKLVPHDLLPDLQRADIVITNYHAFKLRETFDAASGTRQVLQGHGDALQTLETEGQMIQRVMGDLMGTKNVVVINDEAHHCYRERPTAEAVKLSGEERKEAEENAEAARLWISGLEALNRQQGVRAVYDLSATPFFLSGSNWPEGTLFPWVMSDFSLMDAIECGIVKLPRVPIADNRADGQNVMYRNLWPAIRQRMPDKRKKGEGKPDPHKLPIELKVALDALYGHYEKTYRLWEQERVGIPPVFIAVCNNTTNSEMVRDYVAGYAWTDEHDQERIRNGEFELFRNYDDHDQRLDRPRTILIDSAALEAGGEIDKAFRDAHATEIEAFKRERTRRDPTAGEISDAEILREVMNTVGRKGKLGEQVRCVVSVSMLTEGWDANNVTHIMGLRAFGSRLICEQVIGRALRRLSYDVDPATGLYCTEYADIMGIDGLNFSDQARPAPPQPPREVIHVHAVSPERDHLEIVFPRVEGFRTDFPKERIDVDLSRMEPYVLTPDKVGATVVQMSGIIGERHQLGLQHLDDRRLSSIAFDIASYWVSEKLRDPNGAPKTHLFPHAKRIVLQWLNSDRLVCKGDTKPAQLRYRQLADEVCDLLMGALLDQPGGQPIIRAVLDPFAPEGSTESVSFNTSSASRHWPNPERSHVNWIVTDQDWENKLAELLDDHPDVEAYAKNHNLHFEVPYSKEGEPHRYRPDFLVRLRTPDGEPPVTLVLEVKGFRNHDAMLKAEAMRNKWIPAVNRLGAYGRWAFEELRSVYDFGPELDAAIARSLGEKSLV
ncbi:DEAD/DEAH box helicase family protein [Mesorhizobium sp. LHD-90]|uniref:BPTD_3080 family restriction endonuclease n=1 Tax=Mesorhizobium sp. LHD-90 TaxID=3071414 RepID=UPI0027E09A8C|nr:DEAD/DEAH box helicase family protein [Mesorhizobium sp. LHD-90]MDQ6436646.1 DEAD/DEAH box helicase family protein [Mesorhizobium sp. LHD-90]